MTENEFPVFELETVGVRAKGRPQPDGSFLVLAGSTVRAQVVDSFESRVPPGYRAHRQRLLDEGILQPDPATGELLLTRDEVCNGSTEAGCIVAGRMSNGFTDWSTRLPDGTRLSHKEWLERYWGTKDTPIFLLKSDTVQARAQMRQGKFVVLAGSEARVAPEVLGSLQSALLQDGTLTYKDGSDLLVFTQDAPFQNASEALRGIQVSERESKWYFVDEAGNEVAFGDWIGRSSKVSAEVRRRRLGLTDDGLSETTMIEPQVDRSAVLEEVTHQPNIPLNQILYGPPGTGKTYQVVERALAILDPSFLAAAPNREAMKARYDELVAQGAISFVTFHQSFGYEDFVEGIKPVMQGGQLSYVLEDGIFLEAVRAAGGALPRMGEQAAPAARESALAQTPQPEPSPLLSPNAQVWRIYIDGGAPISQLRDKVLARGEMRVGHFGMSPRDWNTVSADELHSTAALFRDGVRVGDLVLLASGVDTVSAVGVVTDEYAYDPTTDPTLNLEYVHSRTVNWLQTGLKANAEELTGKRFSPVTLQRVKDVSAETVLQRLGIAPLPFKSPTASEPDPVQTEEAGPPRRHVLIIDEINRGNVAKIFGELITLLESGKRAGRAEALTVKLPLSRRSLSVPDTLYVIGTMNTADRSLTQLDTALRRRFTFQPVWPEPEVLRELTIDGITLDLRKFLYAINERIERLLSREQMIGHAYLLDIPGDLPGVAGALRERILPQLEEYFFDDWGKIREVLDDPHKEEHLQFVQERKIGGEKRHRINEAAFGELEAFRLVYSRLSDDTFPFEA